MSTTSDRNDPGLSKIRPDGQQEAYYVLPEEERAKGYVRPLRLTYTHVGLARPANLRPLTEEEAERYPQYDWFEPYGDDRSPVRGRFYRETDFKGCGAATTMGPTIAETYARAPKTYGGTFCVHCRNHFPVEQFVWEDGERVGS